jgi:hypothetical protein
MCSRSVIGSLLGSLLISTLAFAQGPPPSDPQAIAFALQSISAMTAGTAISDVTLTGNATWYVSGTDTGAATLRALGTGESRMDLAITSGTRTEIRDSQTGAPIGQWTNPDGSTGLFVFQNCQTDAVWFFPVLGSLAAGPNVVLSYIGQETRNGESVQHIRSYVYQSNPPPGISTQQLSTMDFYLDATSLLPVATVFNSYTNTGNTSISVEVDFSNYQSLSGALVPTHIQRYSQGNLLTDVTVSGASFNTGLPLSLFSIN